MRTSDGFEARSSRTDIWRSSFMNDDVVAAASSSQHMRVTMRSTRKKEAACAGTKLPLHARRSVCTSCRKKDDLPDAFGPETIASDFVRESTTSLAATSW